MPPRQGQSSYDEIMTWYSSIPPITKALFMLCIGTTTVSTFGLIRPSSLILYWPDIRNKLQLWRLVSCFFVNRFSLGFAFNTYFLYRNSLQLETEIFNRQPADYIFFLLVTGGIQLAATSVLDLYVLNDGLLLAIAYLWSQYNRETVVSFMFGIRFKAMYLPVAMIASDFLMSGAIPKASLVGLAAAYVYHTVTTDQTGRGSRPLLQTPEFLKRLFPPASRGGFRAGGQPAQARTNMFGGHSWGTGHRLGS